ncbi:MAG: hypothetical protein SFZ03_08905 [Candidatus Melainabacteria bacterium]|nr:hypothetical protein [Candidatus Melainabacteria bacterium]
MLDHLWYLLKLTYFVISAIVSIGFLYQLAIYLGDNQPELILSAKRLAENCPTCHFSADVLTVAQQLGRLDIVSLGLTILGAVVAIFGFVGFWMIRSEAIKTSEDTVKKELPQLVKEVFSTKEGKQMLKKAVEEQLHTYSLLLNKSTSPTDDSEIAQNVWDDKDQEGDT